MFWLTELEYAVQESTVQDSFLFVHLKCQIGLCLDYLELDCLGAYFEFTLDVFAFEEIVVFVVIL